MKARTLAAAALLLPALAACDLADVADALETEVTAPAAPVADPTATPRPGRLRVAEPVDDGTYDRDAFGDGWADLDDDGCETREEILARDLVNTTIEDGCDVKAGTLHDPYTGRTIGFSDDQWWTVHVDHIYPLSLAWQMGADDWTAAKRLRFANDPTNLLAVDGPTNSSKGDSGPGEWVPLNRAYACTYAHKYTRVARTYDLPVSQADLSSLKDLAATCSKETR